MVEAHKEDPARIRAGIYSTADTLLDRLFKALKNTEMSGVGNGAGVGVGVGCECCCHYYSRYQRRLLATLFPPCL